MIDKTIFGRVVLCLECAEESLFSSKDLYSGSGVLGQVKK